MTALEAIEIARPDLTTKYMRTHVWALVRGGRANDADHLLDDVLAKDPDNRDAKILRVVVAGCRELVSEALRRADALAADPKVTPGELNLIAWYRLSEAAT